jgi:hypothetical protein
MTPSAARQIATRIMQTKIITPLTIVWLLCRAQEYNRGMASDRLSLAKVEVRLIPRLVDCFGLRYRVLDCKPVLLILAEGTAWSTSLYLLKHRFQLLHSTDRELDRLCPSRPADLLPRPDRSNVSGNR